MSQLNFTQKPFYTYLDKNGNGISQEYLNTYAYSLIFDPYNRTIHANDGTFGNHFRGSYHGEIFNDFENNVAYGNYSSAHGLHNIAYNVAETVVGKYNLPVKNSGELFIVGNGRYNQRSNAFEVYDNGNVYVKETLTASDVALLNKPEYSLSKVGIRLDNVESYSYSGISYLSDVIDHLPKFGTVVVEHIPQFEYVITTDGSISYNMTDEDGLVFNGDIIATDPSEEFIPREDKIYLVHTSDEPNDEYDEYFIVNNRWELIGKSNATLKKTFATKSYTDERFSQVSYYLSYLDERISYNSYSGGGDIDTAVAYLLGKISESYTTAYERDLSISYDLETLSNEVLYSNNGGNGNASTLSPTASVEFVEVTSNTIGTIPSSVSDIIGKQVRVIYYNTTSSDLIIYTPAETITKSNIQESKQVKAGSFNELLFISGPNGMIFVE